MLHLTRHVYVSNLSPSVPISFPITFLSYVCSNNESILYVTSLGETPGILSISFAHILILIFNVRIKLWMFGDPPSNFILFLSYHSDRIPHPRIIPHIFRRYRCFTSPNHWALNMVHWLCRVPEIFHHSSIFIHTHHENLHVIRIWLFDSVSMLQNGHSAYCGSIIPKLAKWSPVFSLPRFASHTVNCALRGRNFCHTMLIMGLGRMGA